jgi:hypothetical protein
MAVICVNALPSLIIDDQVAKVRLNLFSKPDLHARWRVSAGQASIGCGYAMIVLSMKGSRLDARRRNSKTQNGQTHDSKERTAKKESAFFQGNQHSASPILMR